MAARFLAGLGFAPFAIIPSLGVLIALGSVVVGLYAGLVWLRDNVQGS